MEDETVAGDEARRIAQHEQATSAVGRDVSADIARRAERGTAAEGAKMDEVASDLRGDAIAQIGDTGRALGRARALARISQVVDYLFALLYGLLVIRLVLALVGARPGNGFVRVIAAATDPFYSLFRGIVASPTAAGGFTLAFPILIAIAVYALLHAAVKGLFRMLVHRNTAI